MKEYYLESQGSAKEESPCGPGGVGLWRQRTVGTAERDGRQVVAAWTIFLGPIEDGD